MTIHVVNSTTPVPDPRAVLPDVRRVFADGRTKSYSWRIEQLHGIERLVDEREADIAKALADDMGRSATEAWFGDIAPTKGEAVYARKHLKRWMRRQRVQLPLSQLPARGWVQYDPLGVVLVIGAWNYPVYLTLGPLVAAVAAGNGAVVKPSELVPSTSALLARLLPKYLDAEAIRVVEGDGATTQALLAQGFDHAFFTGGTDVGRKIMAGAAPTLTPVTLELGGKSPVVVLDDADLDVAARRIAWVKLLNSGQTCIAPDYVLAQRSIVDPLSEKIVQTIRQFRADEAEAGLRIINERQFDRLASLISDTTGRIVAGGGIDRERLRIEPTVIVDPAPADEVMSDEIFGPILPIIGFENAQEAVAFVNSHPKPLALYVFSESRGRATELIDSMPSGGAVINHIAMHCMIPAMPFGGVGASGMGGYHGRWGFEALSHRRAVLSKPTRPDLRLMYPPYTDRALSIMRKFL